MSIDKNQVKKVAKLSRISLDDKNLDTIQKIIKINHLISAHEEEIANDLLEYLDNHKVFELIGKNKANIDSFLNCISFINKFGK